jgi:hypothetical protein
MTVFNVVLRRQVVKVAIEEGCMEVTAESKAEAAAKARRFFKRSQASDESRVIYEEIIRWDRSWINSIEEACDQVREEVEAESEQGTETQVK